MIDHLVYAVPDLATGVHDIAERFGVEPTRGGSHDGLGTANYLLSLGGGTYLEIIGPDHGQPAPAGPRPFGIDTIETPRLSTWAERVVRIEDRVAAARALGHDPGEVVSMSRARPDGVRLAWRLAIDDMAFTGSPAPAGGVVPFLIDWGETPHPSASLPTGCALVELTAEHPDPEGVGAMLRGLNVEMRVTSGLAPSLIAVIDTPAGRVELR